MVPVQPNRGKRGGFRVNVLFLYHKYAPDPLDKHGRYESDNHFSKAAANRQMHQMQQSSASQVSATSNATQTPQDQYIAYKSQMRLIKEERVAELLAEENAPFCVASATEKPTELQFRFPELKAWYVHAALSLTCLHGTVQLTWELCCRSNECVYAIEAMLRAQEEMHPKNKLSLRRDINGTLNA